MTMQRGNAGGGARSPNRVAGSSTPRQSQPRSLSRTATVLWMVAISMGLFFLPLFLLATIVNDDVKSLETDLGTIRRSLTNVPTPLPEVRKLLTPLAQVQGQIAQAKAVYPTLTSSRTDWPAVMQAIGGYNPEQITLISLSRAENHITLAGRANDENSVVGYVASLEQSNLFSSVNVQSLQLIDTSSVTMTVTASRGITPTAPSTPAVTATPTPDPRDQYEPDDSQPQPIYVGQGQQHNFFPNGDVDNAAFLAKAFEYYRVRTTALAPGVDTVLTVSVGGSTYVNDDATPGSMNSEIVFQNLGPDTTALITVTDRGAFGPDKTYTLLVEATGPPPTTTPLPAPTSTPQPSQAPSPTFTPVIIYVTATPIPSAVSRFPSTIRLSDSAPLGVNAAVRGPVSLGRDVASLAALVPSNRLEHPAADLMAVRFVLILELKLTPP